MGFCKNAESVSVGLFGNLYSNKLPDEAIAAAAAVDTHLSRKGPIIPICEFSFLCWKGAIASDTCKHQVLYFHSTSGIFLSNFHKLIFSTFQVTWEYKDDEIG